MSIFIPNVLLGDTLLAGVLLTLLSLAVILFLPYVQVVEEYFREGWGIITPAYLIWLSLVLVLATLHWPTAVLISGIALYSSNRWTKKIVWHNRKLLKLNLASSYKGSKTKLSKPKKGLPQTLDPNLDPFFEAAKAELRDRVTISSSDLMRLFPIGYARSARILDELSDSGYVGPPDGAKPRIVLLRS